MTSSTRTKKRFEDFLDRDRTVAGFGFKLIEEGEAGVVNRLHSPVQHREDERVLGREMIIHRREVDVGGSGNGAQRSRFEAVGGDEAFGCFQDGELGRVEGFGHVHRIIQTFV